ncbi:hypothetical protein FS837_008232 [Tulasnella sp. UAMH 9824]|nr:hypothetical protein FS837_008232 [Tulasnella sp. UAMH 9824]
MDDAHTSKITAFLRTRSDARVLIIIGMHSSDMDGKVEWVNATKRTAGRRGLVSEVLNGCIGIPVMNAIRDLNGEKGLMLLTCGGTLACEGSRTDLESNLLG